LFCSISSTSLNDQKYLNQIIGLFEAQEVLKDVLFLLVACEELTQIKGAAFDTLRRAGVRIGIEGMLENIDFLRYCDGSYWFVNATDIASMAAAEFTKNYYEIASAHDMNLVALEAGGEAQLVDLIDLNISLLTSKHLSPPRLVRNEEALEI
jgi:hypothetical protein